MKRTTRKPCVSSSRWAATCGAAAPRATEQYWHPGNRRGAAFRAARDTALYAGALALRMDVGSVTRKVAALSHPNAAAGEPAELAGMTLDSERTEQPAVDPQAVLAAGMQELTAALVEGQSLNAVLRIVLETLYRALGVRRVLLAVRDVKAGAVVGRLGFGEDVDRVVRSFSMPLIPSGDAFHAAASRNLDILIRDVDDPQIASRIPAWYRDSVAAGSFLVLPLTVGDRLFGLIYADSARPGGIRVNDAELKLVKTLRNQALLAIRQSGGA